MSYDPNYQTEYQTQSYGNQPGGFPPPATVYAPPPQKPVSTGNLVWHIVLAIVLIAVPGPGHIIIWFMIFTDNLSFVAKLFWFLISLVPWVGPFLYLLFGQKRGRLLPGLRD